jgi:hypothetical protein
MAEIVKKASSKPKAPAKPRKAAAGTKSGNGAPKNNVTAIRFSHDQVALLAHRYFIERGHQHGHHLEGWFRAEQELRARAS